MRGRVNVVKEAITEFAGSKPRTLAEIVAAVRPSVLRRDEYATLGGDEAKLTDDVRRALASLRDDGLATFAGVTSTGKWKVTKRAAKA